MCKHSIVEIKKIDTVDKAWLQLVINELLSREAEKKLPVLQISENQKLKVKTINSHQCSHKAGTSIKNRKRQLHTNVSLTHVESLSTKVINKNGSHTFLPGSFKFFWENRLRVHYTSQTLHDVSC